MVKEYPNKTKGGTKQVTVTKQIEWGQFPNKTKGGTEILKQTNRSKSGTNGLAVRNPCDKAQQVKHGAYQYAKAKYFRQEH